jgi:hypothetical protein
MNRCLAFIGALIFALISVSSACTAAPTEVVHFAIERGHESGDRLHVSFSKDVRGRNENNWSTDFRPTDLVGLDLAGLRGPGSRPVSFAIVREAGRLDCSGHGGESYAGGSCNFTANPAFTQLLESRGIGRPTDEQSFGLMAVNARRDIIDAVAAAHYPTPSIDNLMALSALGVDGGYISEMARAGYRPRSIDTLIEFKALNITPAWIGQFVRIGYGNLPADELVQLKALNITPEFVQRIAAVDGSDPTVDKLVQIKSFGKNH